MKPGYKTSEFWLTVLVGIAATVLLVANKIDSTAWLAIVGGTNGGYSLSRGLAKTSATPDPSENG